MSGTKRYSDEELELFKIQIEQKLEKSKTDLAFLLDQIKNITESATSEGDWKEDTSGSDLEMLYTMVNRNRRHIQDLENALIRIRHKNYGICVITGELIDKRRLMAVPTTTKSLAAKNATALTEEKKERKPPPVSKSGQQKTTTKIIRKKITPVQSIKFQEENEDDFLDDELLDGIELDDSQLDSEDYSD